MSQEKAQLIAPIDSSFTVPGVTVSGVLTATSFDGTITGVADSITQGKNLNVGVITALSFAGNLTGNAGGLTGSPNTVAGVVTATSFIGGLTGNITGDVIGNATGVGGSILQGTNLNVGIATAWKWYGDGSSLTGVASSAYAAQNVTASTAETIIDLTYGNLVYLTQSSNTTVGFASTAATQQVTIVRNTDSSNTISWPDRITWSGGSAPTLFSDSQSSAFQVFRFLSVDSGLTYNGWEEMKNDPAGPFEAWMWGWNVYGELGLNDTTNRSSPTQLSGSWSTLLLGSGYPTWENAAIKSDGTLWAWGNNGMGELGHNTVEASGNTSPKQVPGTTWNGYPVISYTISQFTKNDGTLWAAGQNQDGAIGDNTTVQRSSPTQIPGTNWSSGLRAHTLNKGGLGAFAIKTDGTLWSWGRNKDGSLGLNQSDLRYSSPVQIPGTTWRSVSAADGTLIATKTDGALWSWGENTSGQAGQNNLIEYSSPIQVGTDTTWGDALATNTCSAGIKTDGTLWACGYNAEGQLGQNDRNSRSSPTQIPGTTWSRIETGQSGQEFKAIKTDGTLWSWGYNNYGQLGQNNITKYSSPVQIGTGTAWTDLGALGAIAEE